MMSDSRDPRRPPSVPLPGASASWLARAWPTTAGGVLAKGMMRRHGQVLVANASEDDDKDKDKDKDNDKPCMEDTEISDEEQERILASPEYKANMKKCEGWKKQAVAKSRPVQHMFRAMQNVGCQVDAFKFTQCLHCTMNVAGAYMEDPDNGSYVAICANKIRSQSHFDHVMTHEMIHAYDSCRADVDFAENAKHHACTEIRAANLSGDCSFMSEVKRGRFGFSNQHQECVRRRALLSTFNQKRSKEEAEKAVDDVFERCFEDTAPFGAIP